MLCQPFQFPANIPLLDVHETLYSWSGRVHQWNGNTDVLSTGRQLFGSNYAAVLHDFPSHVGVLCSKLSEHFGDPRIIALRHTLLGYFLPLVELLEATAILDAAVLGSVPSLKFRLGIAASRVGGCHPLKGCESCFDADEATDRSAFWRLFHQFPSVVVCRHHLKPLRQIVDPITPVHHREFILPRSGVVRNWVEIPVDGSLSMERLCKLASLSESMASLAPGSLDPKFLSCTYQAALAERGYVTQGGSLRVALLAAEMRGYYAGMEDLPGFAPLKSVRQDWLGFVGSLARRRPRNGHPLKHLLLINVLFDNWSAFWNQYQASKEYDNNRLDILTDDNSPVTDSRRDTFLNLIEEQHLSITAAAKGVNVTTSTGVRWAKLADIHFTPRTKTLTQATLSLVRRLLLKGEKKREIVSRTGVSEASLNRLLSSEPATRSAWLEAREIQDRDRNRARLSKLIAENPGVPIKRLRLTPQNGYDWLYRHDRQWLSEHLPALW